METFTVVIKNLYVDKTRNIKVRSEDTWLAHKQALEEYNQLREEIALIKDSRNNEVYSLNKGFIFEDYK